MRSPAADAAPGSIDVTLRRVIESGLCGTDPMHPAVVQGDAVLTYGELLTKSRELAAKLTSGTGPVLISKPRGVESLTEMVGCILAERPFVPVTPDSTIDPTTLPDTPEGCGYLLTTSGTSGEPKVVVGSRSGLARYLQWQQAELALDPSDVVSNTADPWFDFSFKETLGALVAGATITVTPPAALAGGTTLLAWLAEHRPTMVCLLPSMLARLVTAMDRADPTTVRSATERLRRILVSGEPFPQPLLRRWRAHAPHPVVINLYGPTESTVIKLRHVLPAGAEVHTAIVPVGTPIPGTAVEFVPVDDLDDAQELCIVSEDLALGYLTPVTGSTRFERDAAGRRRLRTGDLASLAPDGSVVVEGRLDHVVKRRGVKVSLPAIEAAAVAVAAVDAAAAVVQQSDRIVLYCGVSAGSDALSLRAIRMALLDTLDPAQLPDKILVVTRLPLDRRAKVDRAALRNGTTGNS